MLTVEQFRERCPSFTASKFPNGVVSIRLRLAEQFLSPSIWRDSEVRDHAISLYVAHYLTAYGSANSGGNGSGQGTGMGLVSSKSVDGASVSYDTSSATESSAGFWNASAYGRELWQLMRIFGGGAIQL